jgi:hypothetical protein
LQRTAGNAAVAQAIATQRASGTVSRSASGEVTVQRFKNPFRRNKSGRAGKAARSSSFAISGPSGGRPAGEPAPVKPKPLQLGEFVQHVGRRRALAQWARGQEPPEGHEISKEVEQFDITKLSDEILAMIALLSPFLTTSPPTREQAAAIVGRLRACADPEVQRVIRESEAKYTPFGLITSLEGAVRNAEVYTMKKDASGNSVKNGRDMLAGITGILFYMADSPYTLFYQTPHYEAAIGLAEAPAPPPRDNRPALGGGPARPPGAAPPVRGRPLPPLPQQEGRMLGERPVPSPRQRVGAAPGRVGELGQQLGSVIGGVRPGGAPLGPRRSAQSPAPSPRPSQLAEAKVTLEERDDPRRTERAAMAYVAKGEPVPPALLKKLAAKMGKRQKAKRGREVTGSTEAEYEEMLSHLNPQDRDVLGAALRDYTSDSADINKRARGQQTAAEGSSVAAKLKKLDTMFDRLDAQGLTGKTRIVYRRTKYNPGQAVPYGDTIKAGDVIADKAYVSSSENRQFLQEAKDKRERGVRFVMFTIIGSGGANISGGGPYTNAAGLEAKKGVQMGDKRVKIAGLKERDTVGQAEILFRRNSMFRIDTITFKGPDVHVVATKVSSEDLQGKRPKDSFSGGPISL